MISLKFLHFFFKVVPPRGEINIFFIVQRLFYMGVTDYITLIGLDLFLLPSLCMSVSTGSAGGCRCPGLLS